MTLNVGDLKNFDDNVNILLSGGEVFSLKIVSTDRDTVFLEAYLEEASKKREFPYVEENALILGDYNSRDLINDLYGWCKKWIKK